jgi:hypothetical protein
MMRAPSSRGRRRTTHASWWALPALIAVACGGLVATTTACGGGEAPPPPPPQGQQAIQGGQPAVVAPPGQVLITVAASSSPQGATVTGGGRMLGMTPFTTQVPIPVAQPGQTQTFQFTFQLPGFQPATVSASPINNTITLNAALAPMDTTTGAVDPTGGQTAGTGAGTGTTSGSFTVRGPPGGRIYDNHTTTTATRVEQSCVIQSLSVDIDGSHSYNSDLVVSLRGPDGTNYPLQSHASRNPFRTHAVRRAAGHPTQGVWTLAIADTVGADSGNLRGWSMSIRCR